MRVAGRHLVILEGRWYDESNVSLKGVFDLLSDLLYDTPHGYYLEQFCDSRALGAIAHRVGRWPDTRILYVGAHGNEDGIHGSLEGKDGFVTRASLRSSLRELDGGYHGLFVASCSFLTAKNAMYLLEPSYWGTKPGIRWVAGYCTDVCFASAMALELYFLNELLHEYDAKSWVKQIERACEAVETNMPGLAQELGFRVYRTKGSEVVAVLEPDDWEDDDD